MNELENERRDEPKEPSTNAAATMAEEQWRPEAESTAARKADSRSQLERQIKNTHIEQSAGWFSTPCVKSAQSPDLSGSAPVDTCGLELSNLYNKTKDSVVQIYAGYSSGTGFLTCNEDICAIATNKHVVQDREKVEIVFRKDNQRWNVYANVLKRDANHDLALVEFDPKRMPGLKALRISDTEFSKEKAFTIGHSLGLPERVISAGEIQRLRAVSVDMKDGGALVKYNNWLDAQMVVYPGNSGGPWINNKGFVVGVVAASGSQDTFGPPSARLKEILAEQAKEGKSLASPAVTEFTEHNVKKRVDPLVKMARGPAHKKAV